jgi:hypothetical protein
VGLLDTILKGTIPARFGLIWFNGFRGEDLNVPTFGGMVLGCSPFRIVSDNSPRQPRWLPLLKRENLTKNHLKIIISETAGPIGPKLWWNGLQMVLFEKCVQRPRPPTKMATVTKNRKFSKKSLKNDLL